MNRILLPLLLCLSIFSTEIFAQNISYGFKAGLNFSTISGPLEEEEFISETAKFNTGFHIGAAINYKFLELQGIRFELMFSQKGQKYLYEGSSFQRYIANDGTSVNATGSRKTVLNISNSYLDFPIMWYGRVRPWLEVSAGVNVGVMIGSTGSGEMVFTGNSNLNNNNLDNTFKLTYNYNQDELFDLNSLSDVDNFVIMADNKTITLPTELSAYYFYDEIKGNYFNRLDAGVDVGLSFFLNQGLFLGFRVNYGLLDVTNNEVDYTRAGTGEEGQLLYRDDSDNNLSLQASIGFSF